jgi:hypothetical protein
MNDLEYRKELLLAKIDAHRQIFRLEVHTARSDFDPLAAALRFAGVDRALADTIVPAARSLLRDGAEVDWKRPEFLLAVCAAVLVVLDRGQSNAD